MIYIYIFNVFWFLHILKQALLLNANTQNPENIIYLLTKQAACLCTGLAVYNQVKKLITSGCTSVLGQKNLQLTEGLECFKLYFDF